MHIPAMQKFRKLVKIWQSYREVKGGDFFEEQLTIVKPEFCILYILDASKAFGRVQYCKLFKMLVTSIHYYSLN